MPKVLFDTKDLTDPIEINLPGQDKLPSVLSFAFQKSGSVLLDALIKDICAQSRRSYINIEYELFRTGRNATSYQRSIAQFFRAKGIVYGVCRTYLDIFDRPRFDNIKRIVLIRDPRDAVVSYYFSLKSSHGIPEQGLVRDNLLRTRAEYEQTGLNDAIMTNRFDHFFRNLAKYARLIANKDSVVYRYEDVIFNKRAWIHSIANDLSVKLSETAVDKMLEKHDVFPKTEDETKHIRKVTPGDYKEKLSSEALQALEQKFGETIAALGY